MKKEIEVPSVGESITSGVIVSWLAHNGDHVKEGDIIFELETDKATLEIPSPDTGILEIVVEEGTQVSIGQTVALLASGEDVVPSAVPAPQQSPAAPPISKEPEPPKPPESRLEQRPLSPIRRTTVTRLGKYL